MKKLVGYITTGFPDKNFTVDLALSMKEAGVDTLELGVPFSDPVADGEVIEKANLKSLQSGFKITDLIEVSNQIAPKLDTLWMGYFNTFYHKGVEEFLKIAKDSGVNGMIIPDLPHEETLRYKPLFDKYDKTLIDFVAPTDSKERIETLVKNSQKFIYLVAYAGITGASKSESLDEVIENIRSVTSTDIYIGFGVNENTAKDKAKGVDGVIVGSAFVKVLLDESISNSEKISKISDLAKEIKSKINE
jgi:tryptophan synthase alpha chain